MSHLSVALTADSRPQQWPLALLLEGVIQPEALGGGEQGGVGGGGAGLGAGGGQQEGA
jgi:hypothetical protein